jgi:lipoprotein NlpI
LDPKNENALKELASSYLQTGKFPQALQTFDLLLEVNPRSSFAFTGKGIIFYSLVFFPLRAFILCIFSDLLILICWFEY